MARLFISYNRKDAPYAWAIRQWLMENQGWVSEDIFFDAEHLHAGVDWEKKLLREAEAAEVMLFLASEYSLNIDSFCYRELKHATGQILAVTVGGVAYNDDRLDRALPKSAMDRQITALDKPPTRPFPYVSPVDGVTKGQVELDPDCVAGIAETLRELGVAPNSYSWTPWTPKSDQDSPFPGLRPLMEGDEALFCGRDIEIRDGIRKLEDLRASVTKKALIISAPSGAGKSSYLRAGLWDRLRCLPGFTPLAIIRTPNSAIRNEDWGLVEGLYQTLLRSRNIRESRIASRLVVSASRRQTLLRSRNIRERGLALTWEAIETLAESNLPQLLATFADADAGESGRRTLLIGIDQAEEMTALSPEDDAELDRLLKTLLDLPEDLDLRLVLTARDDSVDATLSRLARAGLPVEQTETWALHRIPSSRLDYIITGPAEAARRANWPITFEPGLIDALVEAAGSGKESSDALPILAITLHRLVARERRPDGRIILEPARAPAFVRDVVRDAVGEACQVAQASEEDLRRLVIPRLATWDPDAGSDGAAKRQVTSEAMLFTGERTNLRPLAEALVNQRLLTRSRTKTGATAYEVTHEALLRVPPLENMIRDCREKFEQLRILEVEARDWVGSGKKTERLVRSGERLKETMALLEDPDFGATMWEERSLRAYMTECINLEQKGARNRRRMIGLTVAAIVILAANLMLVVAAQMTAKARTEIDYLSTKAEKEMLLGEQRQAIGTLHELVDKQYEFHGSESLESRRTANLLKIKESGADAVEVFFGTNRRLFQSQKNNATEFVFTDTPNDLSFGTAWVSLPKDRKIGTIPRKAWWKFESKIDPLKHAFLLPPIPLSKDQFLNEIRNPDVEKSKSALLFLHGLGVGFEEAALRTGQMKKDLGFGRVPIFFSWPSENSRFAPTQDDYEKISASKDDLSSFFSLIVFSAQFEQIFVVAQDIGVRCLEQQFFDILSRSGENGVADAPFVPKITLILAAPTMNREEFLGLIPVLHSVKAPITAYLQEDALGVPDHQLVSSWMMPLNNRTNGISAINTRGVFPKGIFKLSQVTALREDMVLLLKGIDAISERPRVDVAPDGGLWLK